MVLPLLLLLLLFGLKKKTFLRGKIDIILKWGNSTTKASFIVYIIEWNPEEMSRSALRFEEIRHHENEFDMKIILPTSPPSIH